MAGLPKRVATLTLASVFLVTTVGFSALVIWQISQQNKNVRQDSAQLTCGQATPAAEILPKPEVKSTNKVTKLNVENLTVGSGEAAKSGDCLNVKYYGTLANGKRFDDNFSAPTTFQFPLGAGYVIPGWDQGLIGIRVGGTRRLVIPPSLAYGDQAQDKIPANSTLVFIVKLVKIGEK